MGSGGWTLDHLNDTAEAALETASFDNDGLIAFTEAIIF